MDESDHSVRSFISHGCLLRWNDLSDGLAVDDGAVLWHLGSWILSCLAAYTETCANSKKVRLLKDYNAEVSMRAGTNVWSIFLCYYLYVLSCYFLLC